MKRSVYFIANAALDRVKIGKTGNLAARFDALQRSSPDLLLCVATVDGYTHVERWFHKRFIRNRIHGEWFVVDQTLATIIWFAQTEGRRTSQLLCPRELELDHSAQRPVTRAFAEKIREQRAQGKSIKAISKQHPYVDRGVIEKIALDHADVKISPQLLSIKISSFVGLMRRIQKSRC